MYASTSYERSAPAYNITRLASSYNGFVLPEINRGKAYKATPYAKQEQQNIKPQKYEHFHSTRASQIPEIEPTYRSRITMNKNFIDKDYDRDVDVETAYVKSQILDSILGENCLDKLPFPPSHLLALYPPSYQKDLICYYYQLQKLYPSLYNQYVQYYEEYYKPVYMSIGNTNCTFDNGIYKFVSTKSNVCGLTSNDNYNAANRDNCATTSDNYHTHVTSLRNDQKHCHINASDNVTRNVMQQTELEEQRAELKKQHLLLKKLQKELLSNQKKQLEWMQKLAEDKQKDREREELQKRLEAQRLQLRQQQHDVLVQSLAAKKTQENAEAKNAETVNKVPLKNTVNNNAISTDLSRQTSNLSTSSLSRQSSIRRQSSMRRNEINKLQNEGGGLQRLPSMRK